MKSKIIICNPTTEASIDLIAYLIGPGSEIAEIGGFWLYTPEDTDTAKYLVLKTFLLRLRGTHPISGQFNHTVEIEDAYKIYIDGITYEIRYTTTQSVDENGDLADLVTLVAPDFLFDFVSKTNTDTIKGYAVRRHVNFAGLGNKLIPSWFYAGTQNMEQLTSDITYITFNAILSAFLEPIKSFDSGFVINDLNGEQLHRNDYINKNSSIFVNNSSKIMTVLAGKFSKFKIVKLPGTDNITTCTVEVVTASRTIEPTIDEINTYFRNNLTAHGAILNSEDVPHKLADPQKIYINTAKTAKVGQNCFKFEFYLNYRTQQLLHSIGFLQLLNSK